MALPSPLRLEILTVTRGLWCRPCAKSTGETLTYVVHSDPLRLGTRTQCRICRGTDIEEA